MLLLAKDLAAMHFSMASAAAAEIGGVQLLTLPRARSWASALCRPNLMLLKSRRPPASRRHGGTTNLSPVRARIGLGAPG
jgi:hypothetical protein